MTRIPRNQATGLEILAALLATAVLIGVTIIVVQALARLPDAFNPATGVVITIVDGSLTFLIMACLMPTWGVVGLEYFRLRQQAEQYAAWASRRHPLLEQRAECAIRAAYLALARQDIAVATRYAEIGLKAAGVGIYRPAISFYYALCLDVRALFLQEQGRYQEALEDYATATRLNLQPATLTAQYYAAASGPLYWMGRFNESVLFARQAITAAPEIEHYPLSLAYRNAALSLAELEDYSEAVRMCELGMQIEPTTAVNVLLMADIAWLLGMSGDEQKAEELFSALEPQALSGVLSSVLHQEYHEVLGRLRLHQGRPEDAERLFQASLTDETRKHLSGLYHLAKISQNRGDGTGAQAYRERLLQESPESFYARRLREQS